MPSVCTEEHFGKTTTSTEWHRGDGQNPINRRQKLSASRTRNSTGSPLSRSLQRDLDEALIRTSQRKIA